MLTAVSIYWPYLILITLVNSQTKDEKTGNKNENSINEFLRQLTSFLNAGSSLRDVGNSSTPYQSGNQNFPLGGAFRPNPDGGYPGQPFPQGLGGDNSGFGGFGRPDGFGGPLGGNGPGLGGPGFGGPSGFEGPGFGGGQGGFGGPELGGPGGFGGQNLLGAGGFGGPDGPGGRPPYPGFRPPFGYPPPPAGLGGYPGPTSFLGALSAIARYDDLRCVPRLLCEVTAGGRPGYANNQASPVPLISKEALVSLLTVLNFVDDLPLFTFGRAALLGYTSRGDPRACLTAYPTCPRDPDQLINYLNNHNGGFFRFFNQQLNAYLPQYAPTYQGYQNKQAKEHDAKSFFINPKVTAEKAEEKSRYADLSIESELKPGKSKQIKFVDTTAKGEPRIVSESGGPMLTLDYNDYDYGSNSNRGGKILVFSGSKESAETANSQVWKFPESSRRPKKLTGGFAFPDNEGSAGESSEVKVRPSMVFPNDLIPTVSAPEYVDRYGRPITDPPPPLPSLPPLPQHSSFSDYIFRPDRFNKLSAVEYDEGGFSSFDKIFGREQVHFL